MACPANGRTICYVCLSMINTLQLAGLPLCILVEYLYSLLASNRGKEGRGSGEVEADKVITGVRGGRGWRRGGWEWQRQRRGKITRPAHQVFKDSVCGWIKVLKDHGKPLPMADGWCQANALTVIRNLYSICIFTNPYISFTLQILYHVNTYISFTLQILYHVNTFLLQALWKLREAAEVKRYAAHLEQDGCLEHEMVLVATLACQLVHLIVQGIHHVGKATPFSLWGSGTCPQEVTNLY